MKVSRHYCDICSHRWALSLPMTLDTQRRAGLRLRREGGGEAEEKQGCWEAELTIREGREAGNEERGDK